MINRALIRIRVVQILFSTFQNGNDDIRKAENELLLSLQKSYDLYFYLLLLIVELTDVYSQRVEARKSKLLPTQEDMNPNMRLIENKFVNQLRSNKQLNDYLKERPFDWSEHDAFVRNLLDMILASDSYPEYIANEVADYASDREFWRKTFKHVICANEELCDILEDESLFWNDDVEIVESFALKTIKKFEESSGAFQELLPMFRDESDREFAVKLLRESMHNGVEYRELIEKYTANWESERIAIMDMVIMQLAITEVLCFPSIPINVSLNEYIDVSKSYSTAKSSAFINGVLDAVVTELKDSRRIIKK